MQKESFKTGLIAALIATLALVAIVAIQTKKTSDINIGSDVAVPFNSYETSSSVLVTTSNTLAVATNTARTALTISNMASKPIWCALKGGDQNQAAELWKGLTVFASSSVSIFDTDRPYIGPVYCIGEANATTTITEK